MFIRKLLIITLLVASQSYLSGQLIYEIKEVKIVGKAEQDAIDRQKEAGYSTFTISSKEINNLGHKTAGDILKRLPRIVVQGPPSFNRNIMMAGLDKEFQCVLINGNRPGGGEDYRDIKLDRIPVALIERIDIIYNPPATLGADATIGAIDIVLKDTPDEQLIEADISFDKTSTLNGIAPQVALSYGNKWDKWSVFGNYYFNKFKRQNINYLSDSVYSGTEIEDLDVTINGITTTFAFEPDSTQKWKLHTYVTDYRETLDLTADVKRRSKGGLSPTSDIAHDKKQRFLQSHTLGYLKKWNNASWETAFSLAQHIDSKDRNRLREKEDGKEIAIEDEFQKNNEIILQSDFNLKGKLGTFDTKYKTGIRFSGLDRTYDRVVFTKMVEHKFWDEIQDGSYKLNEYRAGIYGSAELRQNKFWISPAIRMDNDFNNYTTAKESGKTNYISINPSLHAKYFLSNTFFIKGDLARQMARPPFNLMIPVDKVKHKKLLIERGNPDLIPSNAWNFGLGVEKYFAKKSFVAVRGFYSQLRNVIESQVVGIDDIFGYRIYKSVNVDSAKVWGLDFSTRVDLLDHSRNKITFWGNISRLGSEVRDPGTKQLRVLNEQAKWIVNGSLDYLNTGLKIQCSIGVNYISERFISATVDEGAFIDELVQAPFMQWDVRIKYFINSHGSLFINAVNIFDETMDFSQGAVNESQIIGRNIAIGISLTF